MDEQALLQLIRNELKNLTQKVSVTTNDTQYVITIGGTQLLVPFTSTQPVRNNIMSNR
jgi:hypothetical protein